MPTQRMATGALIVGASYLFLAALSWKAGNVAVHWHVVRAVLGGADVWRVVHSSHRYRAVCAARAAATRSDDGGVLVSGDLRREPGRRPGWNPVDAHEPSGLLRAAGRDLRGLSGWTAPDGRARPPGCTRNYVLKPIQVDNSLIRTLVSVSEYSWPIKSRENFDDSVFQAVAVAAAVAAPLMVAIRLGAREARGHEPR